MKDLYFAVNGPGLNSFSNRIIHELNTRCRGHIQGSITKYAKRFICKNYISDEYYISKISRSFSGNVKDTYLMNKMDTTKYNVVVLYTNTKHGIQIEGVLIFDVMYIDEKPSINIYVLCVNNELPPKDRSISGSEFFNWFYKIAKRVGTYCIRLNAIRGAMHFWDRSKFDFMITPTTTNQQKGHIQKIHTLKHRRNETGKIALEGRNYFEDIITYKRNLRKKHEINHEISYYHDKLQEFPMERIMTPASSVGSFYSARGSPNSSVGSFHTARGSPVPFSKRDIISNEKANDIIDELLNERNESKTRSKSQTKKRR